MRTIVKLVEKRNHNACHGIFVSRESAERHLALTVPQYCERGFFMDKTLRPEHFVVIEAAADSPSSQRKRRR